MRIALFLPLWVGCIVLCAGCGAASDLTGSQCELMSCGYSDRVCEFYSPPNDTYKLTYTTAQGNAVVAVLVIDLAGLDDPTAFSIEGEEFVTRVELYRSGVEDWPEFVEGALTISRGGLEAGARLEGKARFMFDNGYTLSIKFSCKLQAAE